MEFEAQIANETKTAAFLTHECWSSLAGVCLAIGLGDEAFETLQKDGKKCKLLSGFC
jgi:hypothetical protein